MAPIEELLHQWADHVNGKVGPLGYPKQSVMESIYRFKLDEGGAAGVVPLTAAGKQTRSARGDRTPEWPDTVKAIDEAMLMLLANDKRAFYALVGYYLRKVPGRIRQDGDGLNRGWRPLGRGIDEAKEAYVERLARAMPWNLTARTYWQHMGRGQDKVASFIQGANWSA